MTRELSVLRIVEISTGIEIIGNTDALDGVTGYKLGRLKKVCESIAKIAGTIREDEQKKYAKELANKDTTRARKQEIAEAINEKMRAVEQVKEEIKVPELKLSEFIAKSDRTVKFPLGEGKTETREIKEGQMLVPQMFFNLLGDIIQDDKNTGTYETDKKSNLQMFLEKSTSEVKETEGVAAE